VSTQRPAEGGGSTPAAGSTPRERNAAAAKAMRRREKRMSGARPERAAGTRTGERPARSRPDRERPAREPVRRERMRREPERELSTHRRVLIRRWVALSVVLAVLVLGAAVWWTPLLGVRSVAVTGTERLTPDQVRTAAHIADGTPMLRLDASAIAANVHLLARVGTVSVSREWPSTVRITITERDPVGFLVLSDGVHLIDRTGLDYAVIPKVPAGLPKIDLTTASAADPRTRAVVGVLAALPPQLRSLVIAVAAKTPGSVTLAIAKGRTVRWGNASDSARKAAVLAALLTRPGKVYDVSSPELPTVS
jgi:cell division protein FtsQ